MSLATNNPEEVPITNVRPAPEDMTDREILIEILGKTRDLEDALSALQDSPMVSAIMTGQNPLMAMMGR